MRRAGHFGDGLFFGMREITRDGVAQASLFVMRRFEESRTVRNGDMGGRQCVEVFAAEVFDNADARVFTADVLLDERRAVCVEDITYRVRQIEKRRGKQDTCRCALRRRLHDVRRSELRENRLCHVGCVQVVLERK